MLNLILGPMFSEKTTTLISKYKKYIIRGKKCIVVKHNFDKERYDEFYVTTHDNQKIKSIASSYLFELDNIVKEYDVIIIDEIQFYPDAHIFCRKWANEGKIVEVCGLNGQANLKPFDVISKLLPRVDSIVYLTAVCRETGENASFTDRTIDNTDEILIGGADLYRAVDRKTFEEKNNKKINKNDFKEFAEIYCQLNDIKCDMEMIVDDYDGSKDYLSFINKKVIK